MKKLYSVFMLAVMTIAMSFTAKADITFTLKVDDPTRLTAYYQYTDPVTWSYIEENIDLTQCVGEGGTFTIPASYGYVYVNATDGNTITSALNETDGNTAGTGSGTYFYLYSDAVLSVTSADLESTRTASCTVNVDDASKVILSYYSGAAITLENGSNTVKFNPNGETPFQIQHINYGDVLYSVKLNGEAQTDSYGRYQVNVSDGDVLDINANFPDEPTTITFSYGDNEAEVLGCISVKVDGVAVEDFDGKTLSAKLGQKITIEGNTNLYNFNYSIYIDGTSDYFGGNYEFTATKSEYVITINATKYTTYNVYAIVDNTDQISLYAGNSYDAIAITAGDTTAIALTSNSNYINVMPATDCYVASILVNGTEYSSNYGTSSVSVRNLNENDIIVITSGKIVRDKTASIWVDDITAAPYGYSVQRYSDRANVDLISGETVSFNFTDNDNPYYLSFYSPTYCNIFNNGVYVTPQYEGSTSYYITFVNGDHTKVYLASEPEKYEVTFTQEVEGAVSSVATDGQEYANWATGFTALTGTKVSVSVDAEKAVVTVDGEKAETDDNGNYIVDITKATNIVISESSGVESVSIENAAKNNNVYNMQGIMVIKNASDNSLTTLPAGLYIINGKKIVIK